MAGGRPEGASRRDLCELLGEEKPIDPGGGEWYCFKRGATKTTGGEGWADVWKRHVSARSPL